MTDPKGVHRFKNQRVMVVYSDRQFGNLSPRFGDSATASRRLDQLVKLVGTGQAAVIRSDHDSHFVDLTGRVLKSRQQMFAGDALITDDRQTALVLLPADCAPVVIYSTKSPLLALVHASRRAVQAGIIKAVIDRLMAKGAATSELAVFIGPSIRQPSYSYPDIAAAQKSDPIWQPFIDHHDGLYYIDGNGYIRLHLDEAGIDPSLIEDCLIDTGADESYYSHVASKQHNRPQGRNGFVVKLT